MTVVDVAVFCLGFDALEGFDTGMIGNPRR